MLASLLIVAACAVNAFADPHGHAKLSRHHQLAKRSQGDVQLFKRYSNARFTFYDVGLGACGKYNSPGDFIVALNSQQFGGGYPGPNCFKKITISYGGKSTQATIMDECPGCPFGGLDFSRGLFDYFASEDKGVIYGTWSFADGSGGGGGGGGDADSPKPPKSTKHTTKHTPTIPPIPTPTVQLQKPTSHSSSHSSSQPQPSSSKAASIDYNSGVAAGMAVPTAGSGQYSDGQLQQFSEAVIYIGGLINAAREG